MKFTKSLLVTKLKATGVHLSLSVLVFIYLSYQIVFVWYPEPYFSVDGGWQGLRLVGAVDLVLGPLITFMIFDLSKSRRAILFDLIVIAMIQFGALFYGVYTTYYQRPVAIVLIDEFVMPVIEENYGGKYSSLNRLIEFSDEKPPIIFSDLPLDAEILAESHRIKLEDKILEHAQTHLYQPKSEFKSGLQSRQTQYLTRMDDYDERQYFDDWLKQSQKSADQVLIAPFSGRYGRVWLVFDLEGTYQAYFNTD
jgi:hypothetical protein